jgi:UDP-glucose 4-epimerase
MSDRLRIDLVLNDFVFSALKTGKINILSNGQPWRPLIDVYDMARAIDWALQRQGQEFLTVNVGSSDWNYKVLELAENVQSMIPNVEININKKAPVDNRSYRVDFSLYEKLAGNYKINFTIKDSIERLIRGIESFQTKKYSESVFVRLNVLKDYLEKKNVV